VNGASPAYVAAVIGSPIAHSLSPTIHNAAFAAVGLDAVFVPFRVEPEGLRAAVEGMRALGFLGASVTVPHKQAVLDCCDRVEPTARGIGAVNCLCFDHDGDVIGHNTDVDGFLESLRNDLRVEVSGLRAVLLGAGGAARAVHAALERGGAGSVSVVARTPAAGSWASAGAHPWTLEALRELLGPCDLLVDCTSAGLSAETETAVPAPVPLDELPPSAAVASLVYHREPSLLADARARGLKTLDGAGMLVRQAARAFRLWTGQPAPLAAMRAALRQAIG